MKLLNSGWFLALLAAVLNIGITGGLLVMRREAIFNPAGPSGTTVSTIPKFWSFRSDDVDAMIGELKEERAKLVTRQTELDIVESHIESEKQELEKTRSDIAAMRDEMSAEIPEIQESERKNLKNLAATYSDMAPTAAVAIFRQMDEMMCVKVLAQMKPDKVAPILEQMSVPDKDDTMIKRAARISDKLRLLKAEPKPQTS